MKTRQKLLVCTAAAAFSSSSQAWIITPPSSSRIYSQSHSRSPVARHSSLFSPREASSLPVPWTTSTTTAIPLTTRTPSRLYSSSRRNDDDNTNEKKGVSGFLSKVGKKVLPTKWGTKFFGSEEEKAKLARKKEIQEEVSGNLNTMLKGAPLGIRMLGKMVSPLMSKAAATMAEAMAEQQRATEDLLEEVRVYILNDPEARDLLGDTISVGAPIQQSSSTMNVNGKAQSRVELAFPVNGSKGSGVARLLASRQDGISQLLLEAGGRLITVSLAKKTFSGSTLSGYKKSSSRRPADDDNIIEAEIIEKTPKE
jgi:hypothetical protein